MGETESLLTGAYLLQQQLSTHFHHDPQAHVLVHVHTYTLQNDDCSFPTFHHLTPMKLSSLLLASLCVVSSNAQYFSAGWTPGAPVHDNEYAAPTDRPEAPATSEPSSSEGSTSSSRLSLFNFDFEKLVTSGPVSDVFNRIGVNLTDRIEKARAAADFWDHRVPLITDDNYDELIVNEQLTSEDEV